MTVKYETCKDCAYYYGEVNQCMYGEEGAPDNMEKKCEVNNDKRRTDRLVMPIKSKLE